jgi:hypothetical protein
VHLIIWLSTGLESHKVKSGATKALSLDSTILAMMVAMG